MSLVQSTVQRILDYEEIDDKLKASIENVLVPDLERKHIQDFGEIYSRTTNFIDYRRRNHSENFFLSLDKPFVDGDIRYFPDPRLVERDPLCELVEKEARVIDFDDLMAIIKSRVTPQTYKASEPILRGLERDFSQQKFNLDIIEEKLALLEDSLIRTATENAWKDYISNVPKRTRHNLCPEKSFMSVYKLLLQGGGIGSVSAITGTSSPTLIKWRGIYDLPPIKMSELIPQISEFSEARLREGYKKGMELNDAAQYAGVGNRFARAVWNRLSCSTDAKAA